MNESPAELRRYIKKEMSERNYIPKGKEKKRLDFIVCSTYNFSVDTVSNRKYCKNY